MVENKGIIVGVGNDVQKQGSNITYNVPLLLYSFESQNKITTRVLTGNSKNLGEARESRQLKSGKSLALGLTLNRFLAKLVLQIAPNQDYLQHLLTFLS